MACCVENDTYSPFIDGVFVCDLNLTAEENIARRVLIRFLKMSEVNRSPTPTLEGRGDNSSSHNFEDCSEEESVDLSEPPTKLPHLQDVKRKREPDQAGVRIRDIVDELSRAQKKARFEFSESRLSSECK